MRDTDFNLLSRLHIEAVAAGVSYSLSYSVSNGLWYCHLVSCSPDEDWIGPEASLDVAAGLAVARLLTYRSSATPADSIRMGDDESSQTKGDV